MYEDWNLYKWEDMFNDIYGRQNRQLSAEEIWYRMIEEVSELVQPVQNQKFGEIENELPDLFAWMMAFTHEMEIDLQSGLWEKFESGCPSCGKSTGCTCLLEDDHPGISKAKKEDIQDFRKEPETLDEWQTYFREIYGEANDELPPNFLLSKLVEDIGLVSKALRRKESKDEIIWRLSSVFAWLIGLCNRYSSPGSGEFKLREIVGEKYDARCPKCARRPCECVYLTDVFISFPGELNKEMEAVKDVLENEDLNVNVFPELRQDMSEGRMFEALNAIDGSDAGVVLLGDRFSPPVFTEYHELIHKKNRDFVFCYVKDSNNGRDEQQEAFIKEIRVSQKMPTFIDSDDLISMLKQDLESALDIARKLGY